MIKRTKLLTLCCFLSFSQETCDLFIDIIVSHNNMGFDDQANFSIRNDDLNSDYMQKSYTGKPHFYNRLWKISPNGNYHFKKWIELPNEQPNAVEFSLQLKNCRVIDYHITSKNYHSSLHAFTTPKFGVFNNGHLTEVSITLES